MEDKNISLGDQLEASGAKISVPLAEGEQKPLAPKRDEVIVPKSLLQNMVDEVKALRKELSAVKSKSGDDDSKEDFSFDNNRLVRLRRIDGELVVGFDKKRGTWKKYDSEKREDRLMMDITIYDEETGDEKTKTVDYLNFMEESVPEEVKLVKIISKPIVKDLGKIHVKQVKEYSTVILPTKVSQRVVASADEAVVILPNGVERTLDIDFINM